MPFRRDGTMNALQKRFHQRLKRLETFRPGNRFLVAVSGGSDSVALLHLLDRVAREESWQLVVGHLDHGLRSESGQDAEFVRRLANEKAWPFVVRQANLTKLARRSKGGLEEAAREARRDFLEKTAAEQNCQVIVLAHHQDDQAETFMLRLIRGAGSTGLAGMRFFDPPYLRPLLQFPKSEIVAYLRANSLQWCEDSTNRDLRFTRNRIRHELMPLLCDLNPNMSGHLARLCDFFAEDETYWQKFVENELQAIGQETELGYCLPIPRLRSLPLAASNRLLRAAVKHVRGDLRKITAQHIKFVQHLVERQEPQGEAPLPGLWVGRRYGLICFSKQAPKVINYKPVKVNGPGTYSLPDGRELKVSFADGVVKESSDCVVFSANRLHFPLVIRTMCSGDRFRPDGMAGTRKLKDFFVDMKLTREERACQPLVVCGHEILWVVGVRRCFGLRSKGTKNNKVVLLQVEGSISPTNSL
ncbi:MAG: tRNA lysidine(34) synthetase TilS [Deltaproteobacteria bacterium]|nr:tRNA lysidine(34) synthetase TilS [Deltaproteobacteria bacterium]